MTDEKHLWEVEHSYYCNQSNYFDAGNHYYAGYESWQEFQETEGNNDLDLNLVFRWDWTKHDEDLEEGETPEQILSIFWVLQRKGIFRCTEVRVTAENEPAVKEWLGKRFQHLMKLWAPMCETPLFNAGENSDAGVMVARCVREANSKLGAIKALREVTGFGLKDAKDVVEETMSELGISYAK